MTIRFLRIFTFLMCALATGIADARTLHVGNHSFALSQTKYTTPSLAFAIPNEATWYAPLTPQSLINTLHIKYNDTTYSICEPFTDTVNYTYDNDGRLIGADQNLYLMLNGPNAYIDTLFYPTSNTRVIMEGSTSKGGTFFSARTAKNNNMFSFMYPGTADVYTFRTDYKNVYTLFSMQHPESKRIKVDKNKNVTTVYYLEDDTQQRVSQTQGNFSVPVSLTLFIIHDYEAGLHSTGYKESGQNTKIYYTKIWSNGADESTLVRNMVPVPACMRIGDFVVPENGMWDIVNQQFYGNSGTGSFIYGKEE